MEYIFLSLPLFVCAVMLKHRKLSMYILVEILLDIEDQLKQIGRTLL